MLKCYALKDMTLEKDTTIEICLYLKRLND